MNYIKQTLLLFLKFRAKEHISRVTAQNLKHPQILAEMNILNGFMIKYDYFIHEIVLSRGYRIDV